MKPVSMKDKFSGKTLFASDLINGNALEIGLYRTTRAPAYIEKVEFPEELPENHYIYTADDFSGKNEFQIDGETHPLLAEKKTLYKGEPLLILVAPLKSDLEYLKKLIQVEYTPLNEEEIENELSPFHLREISKGNIEKGMEEAFQIVEQSYQLPAMASRTFPLASVSVKKEPGGVLINTQTQWPSLIRRNVSALLGLPLSSIKINPTNNDCSLEKGIWINALLSCYAAFVAQTLRRAVRLRLDPKEDFQLTPFRPPAVFNFKAGIDSHGKLLALEVSFEANLGAYSLMGKEILDQMMLASAGVYQCRNILIKGKAGKSFNPPRGPSGGWGLPQGFTAMESFSRELAEFAFLTPSDWKKENFLRQGNTFVSGGSLSRDIPLHEMLPQILEQSGFERKYAAYEQVKIGKDLLEFQPPAFRGIGLSTAYTGTDFLRRDKEISPINLSLILDKESRVSIISDCLPDHKSLYKVWRSRSAEILGIDEKNIDIILNEGGTAGPAGMGRNSSIVLKLIEQACEQIKKKRFREALPIEILKSYRRPASAAWKTDEAEGIPFVQRSWGCCICECSQETLSREISVKHIWLLLNCGTILDKNQALALVENEIYRSLGWVYKEKNPLEKYDQSDSYYNICRYTDKIDFTVHFHEEKGNNRQGALDGLVSSLIPAAFLQAVNQCTGQRNQLPLRYSELFERMES